MKNRPIVDEIGWYLDIIVAKYIRRSSFDGQKILVVQWSDTRILL